MLIIDEGHNISENCDESMSFQIESALIEGCLEELEILSEHWELIAEDHPEEIVAD